MYEIETKVLEIDPEDIKLKLLSLGAKEIGKVLLVVDWYGPKGLTHDGDDPWFLRVRNSMDGNFEVTWKAKSKILGTGRKHKEINFSVSDQEKIGELFKELDLEKYAHQEKYRTSWTLGDSRFDLDQYPNMPAFLEIETDSEESINKMVRDLDLKEKETWNDGERTLIKGKYGLNWYDMRF